MHSPVSSNPSQASSKDAKSISDPRAGMSTGTSVRACRDRFDVLLAGHVKVMLSHTACDRPEFRLEATEDMFNILNVQMDDWASLTTVLHHTPVTRPARGVIIG